MEIYEEKYFNSLDDLMDICWSGAIDRLKEVAELDEDKQQQFVDYVIECNVPIFTDTNKIITTTQINDFIWFECDDFIEELKEDEEEDEEED